MRVKKKLFEKADELLNKPDRDIMALSLNKNEKWAENYLIATNIRLRNSIDALKKSVNINSWIMRIMTFILIILTGILVWIALNSV